MARTILKGYQFMDKTIDIAKIKLPETLENIQTTNTNNTLNEPKLDENSTVNN